MKDGLSVRPCVFVVIFLPLCCVTYRLNLNPVKIMNHVLLYSFFPSEDIEKGFGVPMAFDKR